MEQRDPNRPRPELRDVRAEQRQASLARVCAFLGVTPERLATEDVTRAEVRHYLRVDALIHGAPGPHPCHPRRL